MGLTILLVDDSSTMRSVIRRTVTMANLELDDIVEAGSGTEALEIMDAPGMYSLMPINEEERVDKSILLKEKPDVVLHVVDAKNLERMLPLTLQLIEAGLPIMLDLNMMDETEAAGIEVDVKRLEEELGIPVVATVATSGSGMEALRRKLVEYVRYQCYTAQV